MVTVSVPGKVHLMGEHAVVYGKPAILAAINLRMRVSVEAGTAKKGAGAVTIYCSESPEYARYAVEYVLKKLNAPSRPIIVTIDSDIPSGYHVGSSAAVAVGVAGALLYFYKKNWNLAQINEFAFEIEKKQHRNPSGGDNTTVTMGGFILYRREFEHLPSMRKLSLKSHTLLSHFFLINTGKPKESTGDMVASVAARMKKNHFEMQQLLDSNKQQVKRMEVALSEGNEKELIDAIRIGERTLEGMGVVSDTVISFIREIERAGGAVKILGGGGVAAGVGFLLCYHTDKNCIDTLARKTGYTTQPVILGEEGIRLEGKA